MNDFMFTFFMLMLVNRQLMCASVERKLTDDNLAMLSFKAGEYYYSRIPKYNNFLDDEIAVAMFALSLLRFVPKAHEHYAEAAAMILCISSRYAHSADFENPEQKTDEDITRILSDLTRDMFEGTNKVHPILEHAAEVEQYSRNKRAERMDAVTAYAEGRTSPLMASLKLFGHRSSASQVQAILKDENDWQSIRAKLAVLDVPVDDQLSQLRKFI